MPVSSDTTSSTGKQQEAPGFLKMCCHSAFYNCFILFRSPLPSYHKSEMTDTVLLYCKEVFMPFNMCLLLWEMTFRIMIGMTILWGTKNQVSHYFSTAFFLLLFSKSFDEIYSILLTGRLDLTAAGTEFFKILTNQTFLLPNCLYVLLYLSFLALTVRKLSSGMQTVSLLHLSDICSLSLA